MKNKRLKAIISLTSLLTIVFSSGVIPVDNNLFTNVAYASSKDDDDDEITLSKAVSFARSCLNDVTYNNDTSKSDITRKFKKKKYDDFTFKIEDFDKKNATKKKEGYVSGTVVVTDSSGESREFDFERKISKISEYTSTVNNVNLKESDIPESHVMLTKDVLNAYDGLDIKSDYFKWEDTIGDGYLTNLYKENEFIGTIISTNDFFEDNEQSNYSSKDRYVTLDEKDNKFEYCYYNVPGTNKFVLIKMTVRVNKDNEKQIVLKLPNSYLLTNKKLDEKYVIDSTGWTEDKNNKKVYIKNNKIQHGWVNIDKKTYYLDETTGNPCVGWKLIDKKWYYINQNGEKEVNKWLLSNGRWYYLDNSGVMKTGWIKDGNNKYYLKPISGEMVTGWNLIDNKWYFMYDNGALAVNTTIDGYTVNSSGVWVTK